MFKLFELFYLFLAPGGERGKSQNQHIFRKSQNNSISRKSQNKHISAGRPQLPPPGGGELTQSKQTDLMW